MTKYQRAKRRIARDKALKIVKLATRFNGTDDFEEVIKMQHYVDALRKCRKGVSWKGSVQVYTQNAIVEIDNVRESLLKGKLPELTSVKRIELYERGKRREIVPITIRDRMTQRVLCDFSLVPRLQRTLIYDNGASMKDKGVDFARRRLFGHMQTAIKEYGINFYALTFDFKSFFDSIPHQTCLNVLKENYTDKRIIGLTMAIMRSYQKSIIRKIPDKAERERQMAILESNRSKGICLGSQISQIMALVVPNKLDHYVKDFKGVKHYIRYMDDGVIFSNDKQFLHDLYFEMKAVCDELGLTFNDKKTKIVKMSKGFVFMKVRYRVTSTGKIIRILTRAGIVRMRRKLKKFRRLVDNNQMTLDDVYNSIQSWLAHSKVAMGYHARRNMLKLYNELFDGYKVTKKYEHIKGGKDGDLLQADKWHNLRWSGYAV